MRIATKSLLATAIAATPAFAAGGATEGNGLLIAAFIGFAALIIAFQFVPALVLFGALLKGIFSAGKESEVQVPKR